MTARAITKKQVTPFFSDILEYFKKNKVTRFFVTKKTTGAELLYFSWNIEPHQIKRVYVVWDERFLIITLQCELAIENQLSFLSTEATEALLLCCCSPVTLR